MYYDLSIAASAVKGSAEALWSTQTARGIRTKDTPLSGTLTWKPLRRVGNKQLDIRIWVLWYWTTWLWKVPHYWIEVPWFSEISAHLSVFLPTNILSLQYIALYYHQQEPTTHRCRLQTSPLSLPTITLIFRSTSLQRSGVGSRAGLLCEVWRWWMVTWANSVLTAKHRPL